MELTIDRLFDQYIFLTYEIAKNSYYHLTPKILFVLIRAVALMLLNILDLLFNKTFMIIFRKINILILFVKFVLATTYIQLF